MFLRVATEKNLKESERQKRYYDLKVRCAPLQTGDIVIPRLKAFRGKSKLQDRWDSTLYEVIEVPYAGIPVFKIRKLDDPDAEPRVLHRNLLQPIWQIEPTEDTRVDLAVEPEIILDDEQDSSHSEEEDLEQLSQDTPKGPTTRSMVRAGMKLTANCVQENTIVQGFTQTKNTSLWDWLYSWFKH